jgi:hypothetical protein
MIAYSVPESLANDMGPIRWMTICVTSIQRERLVGVAGVRRL